MEGPWVFGLVVQDVEILEKNRKIIAANKIIQKYAIRTMYPVDKDMRKKCYKDGRKVNTLTKRVYKCDEKGILFCYLLVLNARIIFFFT